MKLDCVLTACNTVPLYIDFIPLFVSAWKKLYPNVDVKIILISEEIPEKFSKYAENIILFKPIPNISTAFISQYIRILYPAILNYDNGIMITDIDMIPMNRTYYTKNIENISDDKFVYMRDVLLSQYRQIAICYNVGKNSTWSEIFDIKSKDDIIKRLTDVYSKINYEEGHGKSGWSRDQIDFYQYVRKWDIDTNRFVILKDSKTGYRRLDRNTFLLNNSLKDYIKKGLFSDYHCYRPYKDYKEVNDSILNIL